MMKEREKGKKEGGSSHWLELADFIQITAPTNTEWHDQLFFISYIDETIIQVIHLESNRIHLLQIKNRQFLDHTIEKIVVISRSSLKGYARQNGLFPHIWVDIYFGGELPKSITAEIRHLEEDMIELRSYPENKILFLDFAYQGVPRHLPIERICIREKPASYSRVEEGEFEEGESVVSFEGEGKMEYTREGMIDIVLPPNAKPDETLQERLKKIEIRFLAEEELPEITQIMEAAPELQRFGLEAQINDLLDAFLSTVPDYKRTPMVMHRIYTHIQRFKELRESFSTFDPTFHTILGPKKSNPKPLIQELANLTARIAWVLPVVNQTKKVYFLADDGPLLSNLVPEIDQKNMSIDAQNESILENQLFYQNNTPSSGSTVKYANMYVETADFYRPFSATSAIEEDVMVSSKIDTIEVKRDMDVLVSNGQENDLLSTFSTEEQIGRTKFIRNRYNAAISYPYKRNVKSKEASLFAPLFPADSLDFRSLVFLPKPFLSFSKIQLPNTSIYQKSELHHSYPYLSQFLNRKIEVEDREISNSNSTASSNTTLSNTNIKHFYIRPGSEEYSLETFLNKCIPDIDVLLDTYISTTFSKKAFTFTQIVDALEPFFIYMEHVSWKSANKIKNILYKHIDDWNKNTNLKGELFKALLLEKYKSEIGNKTNVVLESLAEKDKGLKDTYSEEWSKMTSSSEFFRSTLDADQSRLFSCMIQRISSELYVPENMLLPFTDLDSFETSNEARGREECWKRVITKKYKSIEELTADNGRFIHYDKEFDKTDYALVEKYKAEQPELDATAFLNFLAENLIAKHRYSRDQAFQEARNMIAGERPVEEGEYAVLFLLPHFNSDFSKGKKDTLTEKDKEEVREEADAKKRVMYFIRKGNNWVHVAELDEISFVDNATLFCNLQENCFSSTSSSTSSLKKKSETKCENAEMTKERMHYQTKERMESEFKDRYELSVEDFVQKIKEEEEKRLQQRENQKKNEYSLVDATAASLASRAILSDIIFSPYLALRDRILQKTLDINTKHHYILLFVERFCREPLTDAPMNENAHWFYCKETNTPLFPKSLFLLAKADKEEKYAVVLNQLCNTIGKLSDDGDAYVDKYSGYILKKIELQEELFQSSGGQGTEEETEDVSNSDDRMDFSFVKHRTDTNSNTNTVQRIFTNEIDQKIYNLISSICRNIYVIGEENKDKMMQLCQKWLKNTKLFISQEKYQKQYDLKIEKRKQDPKLKIPDTFETYQKKQHILIAVLSVLIVVQTAVPEMAIKRTFPGCVKSFSGYPLKDGQDDLSSIHYMACVLKKMYANHKEENHLLPKKETELVTILVNTLKDVILLQPDILHLYDVKREYLRSNLSNDFEEERGVTSQWLHFLPPMLAFHIPNVSIETVSPSGNHHSHILNVYLAKNQSLTMLLIEYIREIVARNNILFQTKSGKAYTVNACCEELLAYPPKSVLEYFQEEDAAIAKIVEILKGLTRKIATHLEKGKARVLLKARKGSNDVGSESNTGTSTSVSALVKRNPIYSYEPAIFYAALLHYAKLGSEIYPIPADLEPIVTKKPRDWVSSLSMPEKIELLEKQQIQMDARKTIHLMNIVHQRHPVSIITPIAISPENRIKMAIEDFAERNADIPLVEKLAQKWLDSYEKEEQTPESLDQRRQRSSIDFEKENQKMQKEWFSFMERNAKKKPKNAEIKKITNFLYDWNLMESIPLSNLVLYQKSLIYRIGILFPSYLHSDMRPPEIPKYWGLIPSDITLMKKSLQTYKTILKPFQKEDLLLPIYEHLVERIQPLMEVMEYMFFLPSDKDEKDIDLDKKKHLFDVSLFCMHLCWMIYIGLIENKDIYKIITNRIRERGVERLEEEEEEEPEEDEDMEEVNITTVQLENKALIQQKMGDLFLAILDTLKSKKQTNVKEPAMMTYADIMREIDYSRDREKQKIKKYFTDMSVEERKAELVLKKLHLGIFAVDTKKLNKYGKNTGLFGDKDSAPPNEKEKAVIEQENAREIEIEASVEYQNITANELEEEEDHDVFYAQPDEDLDDFFGEGAGVEEDEDYEDIHEYARENE